MTSTEKRDFFADSSLQKQLEHHVAISSGVHE